jgi:hypothetical protein
MIAPSKINFGEKFTKLPNKDYSVRIIAKMNDYEFKIVRFKGEFVWHRHPDTDETFIIAIKAAIYYDNDTPLPNGIQATTR